MRDGPLSGLGDAIGQPTTDRSIMAQEMIFANRQMTEHVAALARLTARAAEMAMESDARVPDAPTCMSSDACMLL